jgi:hypothetical protein
MKKCNYRVFINNNIINIRSLSPVSAKEFNLILSAFQEKFITAYREVQYFHTIRFGWICTVHHTRMEIAKEVIDYESINDLIPIHAMNADRAILILANRYTEKLVKEMRLKSYEKMWILSMRAYQEIYIPQSHYYRQN